MYKVILVTGLVLLSLVSVCQEKVDSLIKVTDELVPYFKQYVKDCKGDSTYQIYWIYTGDEKPEYYFDSTLIKGINSKVIVITPTIKKEWIKEIPSFDGFSTWLKQLKNKE